MPKHTTIIDFASAHLPQGMGFGSAPQMVAFAPAPATERAEGDAQEEFCEILPWEGTEAWHRADYVDGLVSFFLPAEPDFFPPAA